jgi:hypothetical protein
MERRKDNRLTTYAKVVELKNKKIGYLHDISSTGFKIGFLEETGYKENDKIKINIIPEEESKLPYFTVLVRIIWSEWDNVFYHVGCEISEISEEDKKKLQDLEIYFNSIEDDTDLK